MILRIVWPVIIGGIIIDELIDVPHFVEAGASLTIKGPIISICMTIIIFEILGVILTVCVACCYVRI